MLTQQVGKNDMPREKLLKLGADALSDMELMAIFLRTGIRGKSVLELSNDCLQEFGSLHGIMKASLDEFCTIKGLGQAKYVQLQAVLEMAKRTLTQELETTRIIKGTRDVKDFLSLQIQHEKREVFGVMMLDNAHALIKFEILFYGTINQAAVHPREIIKRIIELNATGIILAHNHPSGQLIVSDADKHITEKIRQAVALIDCILLDHIIVGKNNQTLSFAETGLL